MFGNSIRPDPYVEEGIVLQVDPSSFYCKVRTQRGQILPQVTWLSPFGGSGRGGDRYTPAVGDRPVVSFQLGYPVIVGFLPRAQLPTTGPSTVIHSDEPMPSVGNYGPSDVVTNDAGKPVDLHLGDRIMTSQGGAMLGVLRGGSVLARASRGAEVFMSKVVGLVRIVSRNWEHFTDVGSNVIRNLKGRIYRYAGYSKTFSEAKNEDYRFHQYWGDVVVAEQYKTDYHNVTGSLPSATTVIYKEQVTNSSAAEIMRRTLETSGGIEETVIKAADNSVFTRRLSSNTQMSMSWKDVTSLVINGVKIHAFDQFGNYIIMQDGNIHVFHHNGADVIMDASGIRATMGSSQVNLTPSDITASNGAGQAYVSNSTTRIQNGGHSVTVTSGGVAIV